MTIEANSTTEPEIMPPVSAPKFLATLSGAWRYCTNGEVFRNGEPVPVSQSTRDYLDKAAPGLFSFAPAN